MDKNKEFEELIAQTRKIVKPLTEEQRALVREMEKRLPDLEKRLKELSAESEFEIAVEEGK